MSKPAAKPIGFLIFVLNNSVSRSSSFSTLNTSSGKKLYFTKVGQLNFSCADCHVYKTGIKLRADIPSPGIGHPTHFPVYRSGMGRLVTLHERFAGCLNRIRAKSFKGGSDELNNLEFFTTFMSNGLEVNGPGSRK